MAHVNCPKCGERLNLPPIQEKRGVRCPACKHEFAVSPPSQPQPLPGDYTGESTGVLAKTSLAVLATLGIAFIAVLIYKTAAGPGSTEEPSQPAPVVARDTDPQPQSPKPKPPKEHRPEPRKIPATKPVAKPLPLSPEQIFAKASPSVVYIVVRDKNFKPIGLGSGFFIDSKGLIVTNHHVIKGAEFATALLSNKSTLFVDGVTAIDADADLAILRVSGKDFPSLKAADTLPKIGSEVYAIGNPRGLENTFSGGMVSGHREFKKDVKIIQTTAPISPGSSGGPLLNAAGEVVGITTSYLKGSQNLNFAVPVATLQSLIGKQGKVNTLASAGGGQFNSAETKELDKAWTAMDKKDWTTASRILVALRKTQNGNPFVLYALGYLHAELGNNEIAIQHFKVAVTLKPDYLSAYISMGGVYERLKQYGNGIVALKKAIIIKPDCAEAYRGMGVFYDHLKQYVEAVATFKKAIAVKSDFAEAYHGMGVAYEKLERHAEAIAAYKKAIALNANLAEAHSSMGSAYGDLKRYAEAIAAYKKAIALKPNYADAYNGMGFVYYGLGQHAEALAAHKKAIAIKPDYAVAYNNMGLAYGNLGRYTDEITAYKKAIALKPNYTLAYYNMGSAYHDLKRYADAIDCYKKAIGIKPDYAEAYYDMGFAYESLRRYADAIAAYKKAIAIKPTGESADLARKAIRRLSRQ